MGVLLEPFGRVNSHGRREIGPGVRAQPVRARKGRSLADPHRSGAKPSHDKIRHSAESRLFEVSQKIAGEQNKETNVILPLPPPANVTPSLLTHRLLSCDVSRRRHDKAQAKPTAARAGRELGVIV